MLHPITCRFRDPDTERRYREAHIDADRRHATITACVMLVPMVGFFLSDLGFFASDQVPGTLLLARIGAIALTVALIARLRWAIDPLAFDRTVGAWWLVMAVFILYVNSTRPPGYLLHNALDTAVSIVIFVAPSIAIPLQLAPPLVLAAGNIAEAVSERAITGTTPLIVLPITYAMVLLIGYTCTWRLHMLRREQFATLQGQLALQQQLQELASTDALTGLPNRRQFLERSRAEITRATRHRHPLALLMLDLDHFKRINNTWGHEAGDAALIGLAGALARQLRAEDLLARMGGEEFAILMPDTPPAQALAVAERLRAECAALPWHAGNPQARLTLSIGVTSLGLADTEVAEVLRRADQALYDAKHSGRNRVIAR